MDEFVKVHGLQFAVIGVFREGVDTFGQSEVAGDSILIPITVMQYFQSVERVDPLYVSVRSQEEVDEATARIRQLLESRHRPGSTYRVENLAGILRAARQISAVLTVVLLIIAAITLAISGIFIMNIMLISVSERTKEIGIRMAVGATRRKVQYQFLLEAVCISLLGGLAGVLLGVLVPLVARQFLPQLSIPISPISIVAAVVVSGTVGAVFGLLPASRAAKLDPVEALRYE
jgi:putative ABC transport system permease protein